MLMFLKFNTIVNIYIYIDERSYIIILVFELINYKLITIQPAYAGKTPSIYIKIKF